MPVEFDTDQLPQFKSKTSFGRTGATGMIGWFVAKGIVKDEAQAKGILTGIVIFNLLLTGVIIYWFII